MGLFHASTCFEHKCSSSGGQLVNIKINILRGTVSKISKFVDTLISQICFWNKFEKLVHLFGFIIRIYHDARSSERQKNIMTCYFIRYKLSHIRLNFII